jgi:uncharacterized protein (DUF2147 family)
MLRHQSTLSLFFSALLLLSLNANADTHDVFGIYLTEDNGSKIHISDCGDGRPCGTIIWVNPNTIEEGLTAEDLKSKASESILGLEIVTGFARNDNDWRGGTIYDPGKDKTYASRIKKLDNGKLEVKGCISFFCVTQIWAQEKTSRNQSGV